MKLLSVVSDPLVIISASGDIKHVNDALIELLRITGYIKPEDSVARYVSEETFNTLLTVGMPLAKTGVFRATVELIDARHQTHQTEARLVHLGDNDDFPHHFVLLFDIRALSVRKAYDLNVADVPHRIRVRERGAQMVFELNRDGVVKRANDQAKIMLGMGETGAHADLVGSLLWSLDSWSDKVEFEREIKLCMNALDVSEKEYMPARIVQSNGVSTWLELSVSRILDDGDEAYLLEGYDVSSRVVSELGQRQYTERLAQLSRQLLRAQESERRRIAQELHDQIGQLLTALRLGLHSIHHRLGDPEVRSRIDVSMQTVDKVLTHVRSLSLDLRPAMLDDLGLPAALNWFGARQSELTGLHVEVFADELTRRLPNTTEVACFRIVQEAVSNAMRHSQSDEIHISLSQKEHWIELNVEDFGLGFDVEKTLKGLSEQSSIGIESMQQRVALVGGEFKIESIAGRGTRIRVKIPVT